VKITWDGEKFDTNNNFNLTTERFTPTVPGKYILTAGIRTSGSAHANVIAIYKNGVAEHLNVGYGANANPSSHVSAVVDANGTTDYFEVFVWVNSTGVTVFDDDANRFFTGAMIAPVAGIVNSGTTGQAAYYSGPGGVISATSSLFFAQTGNIGIGTTSPANALDVYKIHDALTLVSTENTSAGVSAAAGFTLLSDGGRSYLYRTSNAYSAAAGTLVDDTVLQDNGGGDIVLFAGSERFRVTNAGNIGIGTTTPYSKLTVWGTDTSSATYPFLVANSASTTLFRVSNSGIASTTGLVISNTGGVGTRCLQVGADGTVSANASACGTGGGAFPFTPSTYGAVQTQSTTTALQLLGGLYASSTVQFGNAGVSPFFYDGAVGNLGLGTTSPFAAVQIATTTSRQLVLTDLNAGTNIKHWMFSSRGGALYVGTTTDAFATSTPAAFTILNNGNVGIGTSTPVTKFAVSSPIYIGGSGVTATSTFEGNVRVLGTLQVGAGSVYLSETGITMTGASAFNFSNPSQDTTFNDTGLVIKTSGNVGIGTSTPYSRLTVWGTDTSASTYPFLVANSASTTLFRVSNSGIASTTGLVISNTGGAGTRCLQVNADGTVSANASACGTGGGGGDPFTHPQEGTSATTSNMIFSGASSTFTQGVSIAYSTTTHATTTNLAVLSTASTTNLFVSSAGGTGTRCLQVDSAGLVSANAGACGGSGGQNDFTWTDNFGATNAATSSVLWAQSGINASSTSRFVNVEATNATTTHLSVQSTASTTNLFISSLGAGGLLKTNANGQVALATAGSDYLSNYDAWTHPQVGTSATTSGLIVSASSSITFLHATFATTTHATSTHLSVLSTASTTNLIVSSVGGIGTRCLQVSAAGLVSATTVDCVPFPFTPGTYGSTQTQSTTTALQLLAGLYASSTVQFGNAGVSPFFFSGAVGNLGLGTTSPFAALQIGTTTGRNFVLSDLGAGTDLKHWMFSSWGGNLFIGTTTDRYATSSPSAISILNSGRFGLGTTSPFAKLSVHANRGETHPFLFAIGSSTASAINSLFTISSTGLTTIGDSSGTGDANFQFAADANAWSVGYNATDKSFNIASSTDFSTNVALTIQKSGLLVGISSTTPWRTLSVAGTAAMSGLSAVAGTDQSVCIDGTTFELTTQAGDTCFVSSARYKHDIRSLASEDVQGLDLLRALNPVSFVYNGDTSSTTHWGFIAEELASTSEKLASFNKDGSVQTLNQVAIVTVLTKAMQEIDSYISAIASSSDEISPEARAYADRFFSAVFERMTGWLADAGNGIVEVFAKKIVAENVFADTIQAKTLCLDDVCVTKEQLQQLLNNAAIQGNSGTPNPSPAPEPEPETPDETPEPDPAPSGSETGTPETPTPEPEAEPAPEPVSAPASEPAAEPAPLP
jgi:hypothetical protein